MATTVRDADELKMFSCDNEDALPGPHLCGVLSGVARPGQPDTLSLGITESQNRRIVEARILPIRRIARRVRAIRRDSINPGRT